MCWLTTLSKLPSSHESIHSGRNRSERRPPTLAALRRPRRTSRLSVASDTLARAAARRTVSQTGRRSSSRPGPPRMKPGRQLSRSLSADEPPIVATAGLRRRLAFVGTLQGSDADFGEHLTAVPVRCAAFCRSRLPSAPTPGYSSRRGRASRRRPGSSTTNAPMIRSPRDETASTVAWPRDARASAGNRMRMTPAVFRTTA